MCPTPAPPTAQALPDPVAVFRERVEARALNWAAGEYTLHEAVDDLQREAEASGLARLIGQDDVQRIMARAVAAKNRIPTRCSPR